MPNCATAMARCSPAPGSTRCRRPCRPASSPTLPRPWATTRHAGSVAISPRAVERNQQARGQPAPTALGAVPAAVRTPAVAPWLSPAALLPSPPPAPVAPALRLARGGASGAIGRDQRGNADQPGIGKQRRHLGCAADVFVAILGRETQVGIQPCAQYITVEHVAAMSQLMELSGQGLGQCRLSRT
ncbi:hypothetical protein WR25_23647 [Diploscapter pachys]|uniref:Uncharacterized protein n=1 Tax=Diploscapter pachys TaxID=2018661 RepID=A0A2A2KAT8_9BILA|nr:hypothetical protein WR25_23647 [Diploscapter pachys]